MPTGPILPFLESLMHPFAPAVRGLPSSMREASRC
jgi:hypothetical protein